ncbi:receptor-type protein kinase, putative [Bodo saltans]|uniref:Receptor-type protein kinase, putative n=1 Tax=Bodo saltans TaxID=75058 RepID=A0A0S4J4L1_BODSA|nr:receptor-type protein kinase, putative [Bodo saltans]|eukprot:CUG45089.1 receptor-type protein kinase, putative [Bodo saltans]
MLHARHWFPTRITLNGRIHHLLFTTKSFNLFVLMSIWKFIYISAKWCIKLTSVIARTADVMERIVVVIHLTESRASMVCDQRSSDGALMLIPFPTPSNEHPRRKATNRRRSSVVVQLRHLSLHQCLGTGIITDAGVATITALQRLRHLHFCWCTMITDTCLASVGALQHLQHLRVDWCRTITCVDFTSVGALHQNLQHLELCGPITDAGLASVATLHQLRHLKLSWSRITDADLETVAALQQLRHLNLDGCKMITDVGLASVVALQQLQLLDLSWCTTITDVGFASIVSLHKLQLLNLSRCSGITDVGLASIVSLKQLRHLDLTCCWNVTDEGISLIDSGVLVRGPLRQTERLTWNIKSRRANVVSQQEGQIIGPHR